MTPDDSSSAPMVEPLIEVSKISKRFGKNQALTDLTLIAPAGSITVLLGPNGAGKTTAIRAITGALSVDEGSVKVFGLNPDHPREGEEVRRRCGVVSAKPALYDRLSGLDNLRYSAELYGLGWSQGTRDKVLEAAERFGIHQSLDQMVGGYSTGMKTRLALSRSVLHEPQLLLFDEPTSGLDPESSHAVLRLIKDMAADGTTIVMCTHLLLEAEGLAEQVVVMENGSAIATGAPEALIRQFWPNATLDLEVENPTSLEALRDLPGVRGTITDDSTPGRVEVSIDNLRRVPEIVTALTAAGARFTKVAPHERSLEELYFAVRAPHVAPSWNGLESEPDSRQVPQMVPERVNQ